MDEVHALAPVITLLLVGILAITITRKLGLSSIVGYLVAGILIGPHALGLIQESETTHLLAELGVVFLLFDIGCHFSLTSIWRARRDILGLGPLQIILTGFAFGGIAMAFGIAPEYAVILGGALALSSTAVVVQTLAEKKQQNCPLGTTATAVLIFQDIFAIFLLIFATSLDNGSTSPVESGLTTTIALALLKAAGAFLAAVVLGRYAIRPLFRLLAQTRNEEVFTATSLLVVLATAAATGGAGLSLTLGAFLAGMIISETPYRHVIQTEAKPFRNLLLGFFFITVGMSLDWHILLEHWAEILVFLIAFIGGKIVLVGLSARLFGWSAAGSVQIGFLLAQGSEFAFVIIAIPVVRQALGEVAVGVVFTGVAVSLAFTPSLATLGNYMARQLIRRFNTSVPESETTEVSTTASLVVVGMDDVGRMVADALEDNDVPYDAFEVDYDRFLSAIADGYPVAFGDPADLRLMETLAFAEREAVVVTIVRHEIAEALMPIMGDRYPNLIRFVGVDTDVDKQRSEAAGMHAIVNRSVPHGIELAAEVLRFKDVDEIKIQAWMQRQQEQALQSVG